MTKLIILFISSVSLFAKLNVVALDNYENMNRRPPSNIICYFYDNTLQKLRVSLASDEVSAGMFPSSALFTPGNIRGVFLEGNLSRSYIRGITVRKQDGVRLELAKGTSLTLHIPDNTPVYRNPVKLKNYTILPTNDQFRFRAYPKT